MDAAQEVNDFLVKLFNNILKIEEDTLKRDEFRDLTVKEMHLLEAIAENEKAGQVSLINIARTRNITAGTLTVAMNSLERKGYLNRSKNTPDRRVTNVALTPKGKAANVWHAKFHKEMVDAVLHNLKGDELNYFISGLKRITEYFTSVKNNF